jgi:hypothetical protein
MSPTRRLRLALILTAAVLGFAASAALARTITQTASHGSLSASFSYTPVGTYSYRHEVLTIRDAGAVQYSRPVSSSLCGRYCEPAAPGRRGASIAWEHLGSSGPQLLLNLYSGGAHCCSIAQVFTRRTGSSHWTRNVFNFGDPGYRLVDLGRDGIDEFLSADDAFAYAFTNYAASGLPLMIMRWSDGRFVDVTRSYPNRIARDASIWMRAFRQQRRSHYAYTTGVIAAWAADEDELGHVTMVATFLHRAARAHELNSGAGSGMPQNARYVVTLNRFLRRWGYLR